MHATQAAVEEASWLGAGVRCCGRPRCPHVNAGCEQQVGVRIVARAIEAPLRWIATNAGHEGSVVVERVKQMKGDEGFNARPRPTKNLGAGRRDRPDQRSSGAPCRMPRRSRRCC